MTPHVPRQLDALLGAERCHRLAERSRARLQADLEDRLGIPREIVEEALTVALEALAKAGTEYGDPLDEASDDELADRLRAHAWLAVRDRLRSRRAIPGATVAERRLFETVFSIFRGLLEDDGPTAFTPYELAAIVESLTPSSYRRLLWLDVLAGGRIDEATASRCLEVDASEVDALRTRARAAFEQALVQAFEELRHAAPPELEERPRDPLAFCVGAALATADEIPRAIEPDLDDASWRLQPGEPIAPADPKVAAAVESARRALEEVRQVDEEVRSEIDRGFAEREPSIEAATASDVQTKPRRAVASTASIDFTSLRLDGPSDEASAWSAAPAAAAVSKSTSSSESRPMLFDEDEGDWPPFRLPAAMRSVADEEWKRALEAAAEEAEDEDAEQEPEFRLPWHLQGDVKLGVENDSDSALEWPAFALPSRRSEYEGLRVSNFEFPEREDRSDRLRNAVSDRIPLEAPDADRFRRYLSETGAPPLLESRFDEPARSRSKRDDKSESRRRNGGKNRRRSKPQTEKLDETKTVESLQLDEPNTLESNESVNAAAPDSDGLRLPPTLLEDDLKCELKPERKSRRERRRSKTPTPRGEAPPISSRPAPPPAPRPAPPAPWSPPEVEQEADVSHRPAPIPWSPPPVENDAPVPRRTVAHTSAPWTPPPLPPEELRAPTPPPAPMPAPPATPTAPAAQATPAPMSAPPATPTAPAAQAMPAQGAPPTPSPTPSAEVPTSPAQPVEPSIAPPPADAGRAIEWTAPQPESGYPKGTPAVVRGARLPTAPVSEVDASKLEEQHKPEELRKPEEQYKPEKREESDAANTAPSSTAPASTAPSTPPATESPVADGQVAPSDSPEPCADVSPAPSPQAPPTVFRAVFTSSGSGLAGSTAPKGGPSDAGDGTPPRIVDIPVVSGAYAASDPAATREDDSEDAPLKLPAHMAYPESYDPYAPRPVKRVPPVESEPPSEPMSSDVAEEVRGESSERGVAPKAGQTQSEPGRQPIEAPESRTKTAPTALDSDGRDTDGRDTDRRDADELDSDGRGANERDADDRDARDADEATADPSRSRDRKTVSSSGAGERRPDSAPTPRDSDEPFWLTAKRDRSTPPRSDRADEASSKIAFEMPKPSPSRDLPRRVPLHEPRHERPGILRLLKSKVNELMHPGQKAQRERAEVQQRLDAYLGPRSKPRPPKSSSRPPVVKGNKKRKKD